jgi:serine/threonine protein kinase
MTFYENVEYAYINSYFPNESVYDFHSGLRLGLSFLSFNTFYLNARWTYLHFKNKSEVTSDSENIMGSLLPPDDLNVMAGASSRFKGDLNTLDINLIRSYCVSRRYVASPRLGLRAAWIDQHCLTNYSISNLENTVKYKNDFWGIGLCASYEGLFKAHKYISFYSDNLFSLLYGRFKTSQYSTSSFSYLQYFVREKYYSLSPNVEMSLGLILHNYFNHNKCKWSLKLGYEFQYWWNQNKLKKFLDVDPIAVRNFTRTYLLFHGLVVSFMLNF